MELRDPDGAWQAVAAQGNVDQFLKMIRGKLHHWTAIKNSVNINDKPRFRTDMKKHNKTSKYSFIFLQYIPCWLDARRAVRTCMFAAAFIRSILRLLGIAGSSNDFANATASLVQLRVTSVRPNRNFLQKNQQKYRSCMHPLYKI